MSPQLGKGQSLLEEYTAHTGTQPADVLWGYWLVPCGFSPNQQALASQKTSCLLCSVALAINIALSEEGICGSWGKGGDCGVVALLLVNLLSFLHVCAPSSDGSTGTSKP